LNTQVKFTELKEIRPQSSPENLRTMSRPVDSVNLPMLARSPLQALMRWNSSPVRRVKHPRLQFDKGLRIDLLA
jgi:hypothetical protein